MNRRQFSAALLAAGLALTHRTPAQAAAGPARLTPLWAAWKAAFLDPSGRVVDALQGSISHSEGQGYAMCLAVAFGDEDAFRLIYTWTEANLAVREDKLLAWRWSPQSNSVTDRNNASDGDLFYAWALLMAAKSFGTADYLDRAAEIAYELVTTCIMPSPDGSGSLLMLPAAEGFLTTEGVVINPSYYMPRAMREVAVATGQPALAQCAADGEALMTVLAAGGPVPDWIEVTTTGLRAPEFFSFDAGYEAMRVPLFLIWSGLSGHPAVLRAASAHAAAPGTGTATVFQAGTGAATERSDDPGYEALASLILCASDKAVVGSAMPDFTASQFYYPATLHLFTIIVQDEILPRCFPI
jgi:endoglucanase